MGLFAEPAAAQKVGTESNPLIIATVRFFGFLPAYRVANELKSQGIVAKIVEFPSATERLEAVSAGYAQISYAGLTASVLLRARGKDVVVVASTNEKGRALVSNPSIPDVKGLKGKKIGVTFGSIEQMTLIATLHANGLDPDRDVSLINMPVTDMPIALKGGSIDAYMGFEPWAVFGVKNYGAKVLAYPYNTPLGAIDSGVETSQGFIDEHPDIVKAVVRAHVESVKYYRAHPDEVIKTGVESYKVPEPIMREAMSNVELTYALKPDQIRALAKFTEEMGFIKKEEYDRIDWSKFINTSFVAAATK
ncbi:MAG TPA: ABC transporter substrate-binding protein [Alphaproteobacteria bacterium]|nr:ABC transporter substrate-binding protein [Alphaproteobacteria bacterium]